MNLQRYVSFILENKEPNFDRQVSDLVDRIFYRLEDEFDGEFFPLRVFATKWNNSETYDFNIALSSGWYERIGDDNTDWISTYLDTIKAECDSDGIPTNFSISADSHSSARVIRSMQNDFYPTGAIDFHMFLTQKVSSKRKTDPNG